MALSFPPIFQSSTSVKNKLIIELRAAKSALVFFFPHIALFYDQYIRVKLPKRTSIKSLYLPNFFLHSPALIPIPTPTLATIAPSDGAVGWGDGVRERERGDRERERDGEG